MLEAGMMKVVALLAALVAETTAHSNLIYPKPRNAIDSLLPQWSGGKAPYTWVGGPKPYQPPCACTNGTSGAACESAQTCLWFSVGCRCESLTFSLHLARFRPLSPA